MRQIKMLLEAKGFVEGFKNNSIYLTPEGKKILGIKKDEQNKTA